MIQLPAVSPTDVEKELVPTVTPFPGWSPTTANGSTDLVDLTYHLTSIRNLNHSRIETRNISAKARDNTISVRNSALETRSSYSHQIFEEFVVIP
jgi:hypothetical protein